jgi:hypothetical protein
MAEEKIPMGNYQLGDLRSRWHNNIPVNLRGGWEMNGTGADCIQCCRLWH